MIDIFEFWKDVAASARVHPADEDVLSSTGHKLNLNCLPIPFYGPLKGASVVLLYLNPGLTDRDLTEADTAEGQQRRFRQRKGYEPLASQGLDKTKSWWVSRTKRFGSAAELQSKMAILEICPYHSKNFRDWPLLAALPSSRAMLNWAQIGRAHV